MTETRPTRRELLAEIEQLQGGKAALQTEIERLRGLNDDQQADIDKLLAERQGWVDEIEQLRTLDKEAATHVESVICMRTHFTGEPPYVGWHGLGLALREALDERDRLRRALAYDEQLRLSLNTEILLLQKQLELANTPPEDRR